MDEAMLDVRGLTVRFGDFVAVDALDLDARDGEVVCVLGPSGCGKSTLLRAIAGLEPAAGGSIHLAGRDLADLRPDQRGVGLMFQDNVLFPHRSVTDNVVFGLRMHGVSGDALRRRADEVLRLVDLAGAGARSVTELSGGEQQRVALARAIVKEARILLLDEPLSNLDAKLRDQMRLELRDLQRRIGTTAIYVTHDQDEAMSLSDRVAVMSDGRILELSSPLALYLQPQTYFAARFVGQADLIDCTLVRRDGEAAEVDTPLGRLHAAALPSDTSGPLSLLVRPEHIEIQADARGGPNSVVGTIERLVFSGRIVEYFVRIGEHLVRVQGTSRAMLEAGRSVSLHLPPERCVVVRGRGEAPTAASPH
jgi:ABC-type Fe3+/spermidine/putrescine transport system ATPase subunit